MIKTKEDLKLYLRKDAERNGISSWLQYRVRLFCGAENACVVRYLRALRHEEYHYNNRGSLYHKIAYAWYKFKTGRYGIKYNLHIGLNMVGYGLRIPHIAGGVIINCKSIGCNCGANSGVVVGNKDSILNVATIGNNVGLAVGCKVIGKVTIGDNVIVAPNAVVVKDVPNGAIVGGVPAKIIRINECG